MKTNIKLLIISIILLVINASCKKAQEAADFTDAINTTKDIARVNEKEDNNWMYIEGEYVDENIIQRPGSILNSLLPSCANVSWNNNQTKLTISFGDANNTCTTDDGDDLQGILEGMNSGIPVQQGDVITVNEKGFPGMSGFKVNDILYLGTISAEYKGDGDWDINKEFTLTYSDGKQMSFTGSFHFDKIQGQSTPDMTDDVYEITGSGSGTNKNGQSYTFNITKPLVKDGQCSFIREGVFEVQVGSATVELDFDPDNNSNCDKKVKININNGQVIKTLDL